jgi:hypothetical protein
MSTHPRFCLLLRQPNGPAASYPLEDGDYQIGSSPTARIRTDESLTAPSEAVLKVDQAGAWLLDLQAPGAEKIEDSEPPRGWRHLEPYDPVALRSLVLEVVPAIEPGAAAPSGGEELPANVRAGAVANIRMGIAGYWDFRERLFARIDVNELEHALVLYRRGHVGLWTLLVATTASALLQNELGLAVLAGVLVLGTAFHVPIAGRAVLAWYGVLLAVSGFTRWELEGGIPEWDQGIFEIHVFGQTWTAALGSVPVYLYFFLASVVALSLFFYAIGWLLDYGLSSEADSRYPIHRRVCLSALGLVPIAFVVFIVLSGRDARSWSTLTFVGLLGAVGVAWPWGPSQWIQRRVGHVLSPDVWLLLHAAHPRSLRYWAGRLLAAGLVVLPFLSFLNGMGLREHLSRSSDTIRTGDPPSVWFWATHGRSLRAGDFHSQTVEFYKAAGLDQALGHLRLESQPRDPVHEKALANFMDLVGSHIANPVHERPPAVAQDAEAHRVTRELLAPFRLDAASFVQLVADRRIAQPPPVLALEEPTRRHQQGYAEVLWAWPLPERWVESVGTYYHFWSIHLLICSVLGFVFLWRRGGESPLARWIGIWLLSQASSSFLTFGVFFMPGIGHELVTESRGGLLFQVVFAGLTLVGKMMRSTVFYLDLPLCVIWTHVCWPTATGRPWTTWRRNVVIVAKVALVGVLLLGLARVCDSFLSLFPGGTWVSLLKRTQPIGLLLLMFVGYALRRRNFWKTEAAQLGWVPIVALVTLIMSLQGMDLALEPPVIHGTMFWCAWILGFVPIALLMALLRRNFLRVASVGELSYVLMVVVVPCLIVATETAAHALFRAVPFVTESGAEIVAIGGVAALLPVIHKVVEFSIGWLVMPKLRTLQKATEHVLETVIDAHTDSDRRAEVARLFERLKVAGYAFYARGQQSRFTRYLDHMTGSLAETLLISGALREFLGRGHSGFVDLQSVPYEWPYFFQQFELYRIEKATGCRYLLPIRLGRSVRGLLLLTGGPMEREICRQPAAEELGTLGVAAIRT